MNIKVEILLGQDTVYIKLLLGTGAQQPFISRRVYEAKIKGRARKQKCYVCMNGVGCQELATTGEAELEDCRW